MPWNAGRRTNPEARLVPAADVALDLQRPERDFASGVGLKATASCLLRDLHPVVQFRVRLRQCAERVAEVATVLQRDRVGGDAEAILDQPTSGVPAMRAGANPRPADASS